MDYRHLFAYLLIAVMAAAGAWFIARLRRNRRRHRAMMRGSRRYH